MSDFIWTENAKAVFDQSVKATPMPFRKVTKKGLIDGLLGKVGDGGEVTEKHIVDVIKATTPTPFVGKGLKAIKPLLTDPSMADA